MTQYHEPPTELEPADRDIARALNSLKEEIEAVDWYHQRAAVCADDELRKILLHNRDEEIEHAAMALEWCRRVIPELDAVLRTYLFSEGSITELESAGQGPEQATPPGKLGIGNLAPSR